LVFFLGLDLIGFFLGLDQNLVFYGLDFLVFLGQDLDCCFDPTKMHVFTGCFQQSVHLLCCFVCLF